VEYSDLEMISCSQLVAIATSRQGGASGVNDSDFLSLLRGERDLWRYFKDPTLENLFKIREIREKLDYIYSDDFFSHLENKFLNCGPFVRRSLLCIQPSFEHLIFILGNFKDFQKTKSPKFLGRSISIYPYLLEQKLIRLYVERLIANKGISKSKKVIKNYKLFLKGLQFQLQVESFGFSPQFIKYAFEYFHFALSDRFKKQKPRTPEDRAGIIKKLFGKPDLLFFDKWCLIWAGNKEPRRIALHIVQTVEAYNRDSAFIKYEKTRFNPSHRISFNKLNKIVSKTKSVYISSISVNRFLVNNYRHFTQSIFPHTKLIIFLY
jgi:hypothetical protein